VLVIGDVVGHDTEAAACPGRLRGITYDSADGPAGVCTSWTGPSTACG
jgi:chemotaxis family two-component system sensor kinase Cph1